MSGHGKMLAFALTEESSEGFAQKSNTFKPYWGLLPPAESDPEQLDFLLSLDQWHFRYLLF